jgi:chorismate dehydratase
MSVKLFSRVPAEGIRTLALDEGSRTSAALVQILLHERFGIRPRLEPLPIGNALEDSAADAVLLIGDRAIHSPRRPFAEIWDLGDEWYRHTELPFVFAMWVARAGVDLQGIDAALSEARDLGVQNLEEIAAAEAAPLGLTRPECLSYLRDNLYFYLGEREQEGLELFRHHAQCLHLINAESVGLHSPGSRSAPWVDASTHTDYPEGVTQEGKPKRRRVVQPFQG